MCEHTIQMGRRMLLASLLCATAGMSPVLGADDRNQASLPSQQELLLVRVWNPRTGELGGWMPIHRVAITLQRVGTETLDLELNDCVSVNFPHRPAAPVKDGASIALGVVTFGGRQWLPLESNLNLVHIRNSTFYVKAIDFGESKWRRPAMPSVSSQTQGK